MITVNIKGENILLYDSLEQLPIMQLIEFEKTLMIEAGIGKDLNDFDSHFNKIFLFLENDKKEDAKTELKNLRQQYFFLLSNFSINCLCFACLVKYDTPPTIDDIKAKSEHLIKSGITTEQISKTIEAVKKKYTQN